MYICKNCGNSNVEVKHWVNINTKEIGDTCSDDEIEDAWCNNCQTHCKIITLKQVEKNLKILEKGTNEKEN